MSETAIAITNDQLALVKRTIAQGATDEELRLFLYDCQRHGVHPLDKMLHFTKRKGKYTPITSIDLMRTQAAETGECAGIDDALFGGEDDDRWARVTVYRLTSGQRFPYTATARWAEYYPGEGDIGFMWRKMPHTMLGKCAEALALRKAFPKQLQGLYAKEEMDQAPLDLAPVERTPAAPKLEPGSAEEAANLFPTPEEAERNTLVAEAQRLVKALRLTAADREAFRKEYLGGADVFVADLSALSTMVKELQKREPKSA